jgi:AraC-like DNA-binding protein
MGDETDELRQHFAEERARIMGRLDTLFDDEEIPASMLTLPQLAKKVGASTTYVRGVFETCGIEPGLIVKRGRGANPHLYQLSTVLQQIRACAKDEPHVVRRFLARYKAKK